MSREECDTAPEGIPVPGVYLFLILYTGLTSGCIGHTGHDRGVGLGASASGSYRFSDHVTGNSGYIIEHEVDLAWEEAIVWWIQSQLYFYQGLDIVSSNFEHCEIVNRSSRCRVCLLNLRITHVSTGTVRCSSVPNRFPYLVETISNLVVLP
jgi:hypothetical protein